MDDQGPIRVVAFGDSLTVGYQSPSPENPAGKPTPYGDFLRARLGPGAEVLIRGVNGELTGEMAMRFGRDVLALRPGVAVILGGTNDLGWGGRPEEIMRNLAAMFERARGAGIRPVGITVPSVRGGGGEMDRFIPPRLQLNRLLLDYGRSAGIPVVDLFGATAEPDTMRLEEACSSDGLHLSTRGYRLLAELLFEKVFRPGSRGPDPAD